MRYDIALFIIGIILIILFFPIRAKTKIIYNVFNNKGYASLFFYNLKLFKCRFKIKKFKIYAKTKKKDFVIDLFNENNQTSLGEIYVMQVLKKIRIKNLKLGSKFSFNRDMLVTSVGGASLNLLFGIILSIICNKKKIDNYEITYFNNADRTMFLVVLTTSIQINLFWLFISLLKTIILKLKKGMVKSYGN